jgi:two-component system chemotaxis sensor kinase CheA
MSLDLSQFRATFFEEAGEHLLSMESGLLALVPGANDPEQLNAIFRSAHSIKGAAASLGFQHVAAFTHTLESLLDRMRSGEFPVTEAAIAALLTSSDTLRALVDASRVDDAGAVDTRKATAALATLTGAGAEASAHAAPVAATPLACAADARGSALRPAPIALPDGAGPAPRRS